MANSLCPLSCNRLPAYESQRSWSSTSTSPASASAYSRPDPHVDSVEALVQRTVSSKYELNFLIAASHNMLPPPQKASAAQFSRNEDRGGIFGLSQSQHSGFTALESVHRSSNSSPTVNRLSVVNALSLFQHLNSSTACYPLDRLHMVSVHDLWHAIQRHKGIDCLLPHKIFVSVKVITLNTLDQTASSVDMFTKSVEYKYCDN